MPLNTTYVSKRPDAAGRYAYDAEETAVWRALVQRQMPALRRQACAAYLSGLEALGIGADAIPQVAEVDARLAVISGAGVDGVDALIPQDQFSRLLQARKFPVATFIRRRAQLDYIEEPDIFHEVFGHAPMLTNPAFCDFLERFGTLSLTLPADQVERLFRLFWFTVEFGLIREGAERKVFGAGIISSPSELAHVTSATPEVQPFDLMTVLRTPYRIDIVQPVYFELDSFDQLAATLSGNIPATLTEAAHHGDLPPRFERAA